MLQTGYIDYDKLEEKAMDFRPEMIISGGSAYPRDWDYKRLRAIADKVGSLLMTDMAHIRYPSLPFSPVVISSSHLSSQTKHNFYLQCERLLFNC